MPWGWLRARCWCSRAPCLYAAASPAEQVLPHSQATPSTGAPGRGVGHIAPGRAPCPRTRLGPLHRRRSEPLSWPAEARRELAEHAGSERPAGAAPRALGALRGLRWPMRALAAWGALLLLVRRPPGCWLCGGWLVGWPVGQVGFRRAPGSITVCILESRSASLPYVR